MDSTLTKRQRKIILGKIAQLKNCMTGGIKSEKEDLKKAIFGLFYCSIITSGELEEFNGMIDRERTRREFFADFANEAKEKPKKREKEPGQRMYTAITDEEICRVLSHAIGEKNKKSAAKLGMSAGITANHALSVVNAAKRRGYDVRSSTNGYWIETENRPEDAGRHS